MGFNLDIGMESVKTMDEVTAKREITKELLKIQKKYGLISMIFVASNPLYEHGGVSVTRNADDNSPIKALREALVKWEEENGHDPDDDWT